jgi:hypothetical protein
MCSYVLCKLIKNNAFNGFLKACYQGLVYYMNIMLDIVRFLR